METTLAPAPPLKEKLSLQTVYRSNDEALIPLIEPKEFSFVTNKMRTFFLQKGFVEVHTQNRLSIMAACEDPKTIAQYNYVGKNWPLPQTGQMWLEYELLRNPELKGVFCVSTSYRNEAHPLKGRHNRIFPMFEFELHGGLNELISLELELLEYLGFGEKDDFSFGKYNEMAEKYNTAFIEAQHETKIAEEYNNVFFLTHFPERTNPFWNMKRNENDPSISNKVDVLLHGIETIGSAERSCNAQEQRKAFYEIEKGKYAETLFELFGKDRVEAELNDFLNQHFFTRSGGGIGITRMIRAMQLSSLMEG